MQRGNARRGASSGITLIAKEKLTAVSLFMCTPLASQMLICHFQRVWLQLGLWKRKQQTLRCCLKQATHGRTCSVHPLSQTTKYRCWFVSALHRLILMHKLSICVRRLRERVVHGMKWSQVYLVLGPKSTWLGLGISSSISYIRTGECFFIERGTNTEEH